MALNLQCIPCNITQVIKVLHQLELPRSEQELLMREVLDYLSHADYQKCNPEIMGGTWKIMQSRLGVIDPYLPVKEYYNQALLQLCEELEPAVAASASPFQAALKIAIAGNLIDFAARRPFVLQDLLDTVSHLDSTPIAADRSTQLHQALSTASSLLYLGDNCGEVCLDKLFIRQIKREFPHLSVTYGVRGGPIVNDVTLIDAQMAGMEQVAKVIDNGDVSLGTVLERTSTAFRLTFESADVVIAKGQGNFESLCRVPHPKVYYLFMAKCSVVADQLGVPVLSVVCTAM